MVALSAIRSGLVTVQNVELTCMRRAHLENKLKIAISLKKIQKLLISR